MSQMVELGTLAVKSKAWEIDLPLTEGECEKLFRAAIEAVRVPTKAMEDAANALDDWGVPSDPGSGNACALAHWEAMINEALK